MDSKTAVMRVLQTGDAAGFTAPQVTPNDTLNISLSLAHLKENGNEDFSSTTESSVHHSSADKLVHSAFNSVEDKSIVDYKATINKKFHLHLSENTSEEQDHQITKDSTDYENTTNTYRSFKDLYHENKSFFVECVKGYENLEETRSSIKEDSTDVIQHLVTDQEINLNDTNSICTKTSSPKGEVNKRLNNENKLMNCEGAFLSKGSGSACEKDVIDCIDNGNLKRFDESDDGENSAFSTSKRSHFLRGIINPNYPGFQQFAHTLSEHFINHPSSEFCDSDLSECEMEFSADSFDDIQDDLLFSTTNNCYEVAKKLKNNNNVLNNNSEDEIDKLEKEKCTMDISNSNVDTLNGSNYYITNDNTNSPSPVVLSHYLPNCLESNLKLNDSYEDWNSSKFIWDNTIPNATSIPADGEYSGNVANTFCTVEIDNNFGCPTPDILIKNDKLTNENEFKIQCRPDLLQNVNPKLIESVNIESQKEVGELNSIAYQNPLGLRQNSFLDQITVTDEVAVGTTPVDIIGNFEQEVEREFGLLVNGYSSLVDGHFGVHRKNSCAGLASEKMADAALSNGVEQIKSSISLKNNDSPFLHSAGFDKNNDYSKFSTCLVRTTSQQNKSSEVKFQVNTKPYSNLQHLSNTFEDNAIDWYNCEDVAQFKHLNSEHESSDSASNNILKNDVLVLKPKYKKHTYDERQLPPVAVDYKCSQTRMTRKFQNSEKHAKGLKAKVVRNNLESPASYKFLNTKRNTSAVGLPTAANERREEDEVHQYQQLISTDKELILSKSRYSKMSFWAQHLKNSVKERGNKKISGLHQSKFSWSMHETMSPRIDLSVMTNHIEATKDFEKKRRFDRDEIRKRLAMGFCAETVITNCNRSMQSDNESHSSDSETCPKLSKVALKKNSGFANIFTAESTPDPPHICRPLSLSYLDTKMKTLSSEDKECDFFTKQARLQIEARMALAQAKDMAHIQMKIDRQKQLSSPITDVIRGSLEKVKIQISSEKRRVSRQMLTDMNIAQLQIIVNDLHTHIENLNESLVHYLMERDELHMGQDSMLIDIEDLTRYLGSKEQSLEQKRSPSIFKRQQ